MVENRTVKLVIFDFDGTLGDTRAQILTTFSQTLHECQLPEASEEACAATIGLTLREGFRRLCPDADEPILDRCVEVYHRRFEENRVNFPPTMFPHVLETLTRLHFDGFLMAVASSRTSTSLRDFLQRMHLNDFICMVVGAEEVSKPKPAAEPVEKILSALHVSPEQTLVVGDMPVDVMMGRNAGTKTCAVTYGNASLEELSDAAPDFIISDIARLLSILEG